MKPKLFSLAVLAVSILLGLSNVANAQLVFNKSDIDGSFGQGSQIDANDVAYGFQPFVVTAALASADSIEYSGAFSADPVLPAVINPTLQLDVRTWNDGFIFVSTAEDALNGTPTASFHFNPLTAFAPNGQQFQDLIIEELGPDGQTFHTFDPVLDLGTSTDGNPYHQISETLDMDAVFTMKDGNSMSLHDLLGIYSGETLYAGSVLSNGTVDGIYEIAGDPRLGSNGVIFRSGQGFEVEAGFAHRLLPVSVLGDFDDDGDVDADDIDFYGGNLDVPATGDLAQLDLNEDGMVTLDDHDIHVTTLVETSNGQTGAIIGDINLDGTVNVLGDAFALVGSLDGSGGYADGDLNADQTVNVLGDAFILIGNLGSSNAQ